jgi:hypothetical protein
MFTNLTYMKIKCSSEENFLSKKRKVPKNIKACVLDSLDKERYDSNHIKKIANCVQEIEKIITNILNKTGTLHKIDLKSIEKLMTYLLIRFSNDIKIYGLQSKSIFIDYLKIFFINDLISNFINKEGNHIVEEDTLLLVCSLKLFLLVAKGFINDKEFNKLFTIFEEKIDKKYSNNKNHSIIDSNLIQRIFFKISKLSHLNSEFLNFLNTLPINQSQNPLFEDLLKITSCSNNPNPLLEEILKILTKRIPNKNYYDSRFNEDENYLIYSLYNDADRLYKNSQKHSYQIKSNYVFSFLCDLLKIADARNKALEDKMSFFEKESKEYKILELLFGLNDKDKNKESYDEQFIKYLFENDENDENDKNDNQSSKLIGLLEEKKENNFNDKSIDQKEEYQKINNSNEMEKPSNNINKDLIK